MKGKNLGRMLGIGLAIFGTREVANGGGLFLDCEVQGPTTNSDIYVKHIDDAGEGFEIKDSRFLEAPAPAIDFYSKVDFDPYKLERDSRPPESMTTINTEIKGRGLSGAVNAQLVPYFWKPNGENNFINKNIIADIYEANDTFITRYDLKNLAELGQSIPITVKEGLSRKLKIRFYDKEDINCDRVVNFLDFGKIGKYWNTSGHDMYDNWAERADINKDGNVDYLDLAQLVNQWLLESQSVCGEPISKLNPVIKGENPTGFQKYLRNYVLENAVA